MRKLKDSITSITGGLIVRVEVPILTRVEGHGHVEIEIAGNTLKKVRFIIDEGPRYFEAILKGRKWDEIPEMAARICGICTVIHTLGAAKAVENAAGFEESMILLKIRKLLAISAHLQSHILHLYFLAWPDYVKKDSILSALPEYSEVIKKAFRIKKSLNYLTELLAGRRVHPVTVLPGRLSKDITIETLKKYRERMKDILKELKYTAEIFSSIHYPQSTVNSEHLALSNMKDIPLLSGSISNLEGKVFSAGDYQKYIAEKVVPPNTTKRSYIDGVGFMVGALPRLNINLRFLRDEVKELAHQLPSKNVNLNNLAQGLESYHFGLEALDIVEGMIDNDEEYVSKKVELHFKEGSEGISAVEAPRGLLFHNYRFSKDGKATWVNIITPTALNFEHIEKALKEHLPNYVKEGEDVIKFESERVIRSYDPCISCSAHVIKLN